MRDRFQDKIIMVSLIESECNISQLKIRQSQRKECFGQVILVEICRSVGIMVDQSKALLDRICCCSPCALATMVQSIQRVFERREYSESKVERPVRLSLCVCRVNKSLFSFAFTRMSLKAIFLLYMYKRFFPFDQNVMRLLCLMVFILTGGFLTDNSQSSGLVSHIPLCTCMLALWHLFRFISLD